MLSSSKNSFKIKQPLQDTGPKGRRSSNDMNDKRNRNSPALQCIPGEYIQEEAAHVRKSVASRDGAGYIPGTLYCTNLRVAFLPDPSPDAEECTSHPFLHTDYDVALSCIGRLVAVNSFTKAKVLTSASTLKFNPEELIVYCRDFRVLRFRFHESGLEPQAFRVTMAIAQAQESSSKDDCYENAAVRASENGRWNEEEDESEEEPPTLLFETLSDWEKELQRLGTANWRVSPVNERFDMSTSLPKYLWVPSQFLDNELKRAFVHFNERRIPRLCWHHPRGSDLLRAASFHPESDPEKEDMRSVETLMLAGHSQCVIVETAADLPNPAEIQQSCFRLWSLSLCLADSFVAPSDQKWLLGLEGTRWLDHVRLCLKKANEVAVLLAERSRSVVLQESDDRDLNCLLASLVQVMSDPQARSVSGFQSLVQREWVAAGHPFLQRLNLLQKNDRDEMDNTPSGNWTLYVFSKGCLSLQTHFFPWKNGSISKRGSRRAHLSEGPGDQERAPRAKPSNFLGHHDRQLLLPRYAGPWVRLWKRCYLRGNPEIQVGLFASTLVGLTEELDLLQKQLSYWQTRGTYKPALETTKELPQGQIKSGWGSLLPSC
ncbi:myotubularin-related protein 11 isoform X2 [Hemicordylus capensis]|uniref:myotubularin-related protein 11 isoform X2 n=1 Tax=Hemicordylus capensis TaxID=884348 RepID=UPI002303C0E7|nr:myotubularin-related protein 11 isoform X2 [Hemicordylus capensis]